MWDNETAIIFRDELGSEERLLWSGRPKQGLLLRPSDALMIPFSLLWGSFAIFWESIVIVGGAPFFFALWGIPFVLIGLYIIFGRFFVDAVQRGKTYYALTNERIIIISGIVNRNVKTLNLRTLAEVDLSRGNNDRGTITFGPVHPISWWNMGRSWPGAGRYVAPSFEMIENAKSVYEQVQRAQKNGSA